METHGFAVLKRIAMVGILLAGLLCACEREASLLQVSGRDASGTASAPWSASTEAPGGSPEGAASADGAGGGPASGGVAPSAVADEPGDASEKSGAQAAPPTQPQCGDIDLPAGPCLVCTQKGWVQGVPQGDTCAFLGIPYAVPPVGPLRWTAPQPASAWEGTREATTYGAACMQSLDISGATEKSEDCLFLNVFAPAAAPDAPLPVMVFVHGGGYTGGASNTYSGRGLSEAGPAVVVTMNYRLGPLGFFAHPDLDRQRAAEPSGSDGIRDQQLALRWVKDNIATLFGDPDNVTLFGESAGSGSVSVHVVSPESRGLARRFIMESGVSIRGVANGLEPVSKETMYTTTARMAEDLCPDADDVIGCLRDLPAEQIVQWTPSRQAANLGGAPPSGLTWLPVIEGAGGVLPEHPNVLMESGRYNRGEILVGTNKNEYALFQLLGGGITTVADLRTTVERRYGDLYGDAIMALYAPSGTPVDAGQAYVTLMTDVMFRCASRRLARLARAGGEDVYLYSFEQGAAMHADELGYVFGPRYYALGLLVPNVSALAPAALVDVMQGYWLNFAYRGDPNGPGLPPWPAYDVSSDQHVVLADPPSAGSGLQREACDFWDRYLEETAMSRPL